MTGRFSTADARVEHSSRPLPPMIAVVGCDGSGKSTLVSALAAWLAGFQPTAVCHLGKQSGNAGRALARLPFFGRQLEASLYTKAKTAETQAGPDLATAIGIYAFAIRRARRFRRMMALRAAGKTIVTDRFPQTEVPGPMDGPGLGNARSTGLTGLLARRERQAFDAMAAHLPNLVLRLNVSPQVAHQRKPDHRPSSLAIKTRILSSLTFQGARIVDIDAEQPPAVVEAQAKAAIAALVPLRHVTAIAPDHDGQ